MGTASLLRTGLENAFGLALNFDEPLAFVDSQGERFFAVNILAGLHRGHGDQRMPVVNRAADDSVDVFSLQQFAKVGITFGAGEKFLSGRYVAGVNVTYGNDVPVSLGISGVASSLPAAADQSEVNVLAGRQRFSSSSWSLSGAFFD